VAAEGAAHQVVEGYEVSGPSAFIFNVGVVTNSFQRVLSEEFMTSPYCESDKLVRLAQHEFGKLQHGFSRVTAICNWIHDNVEYLQGSSNPLTSAYDTATERAGVCRDFAHLAIAFCRAVLIPARFVAGYAYALQPPDFHAYFEAYLNGAWYIFDSTRLTPQTGLIRVGSGHDAADTSFATIFGPATFSSLTVMMELQQGPAPIYTTDAISTS
jgi:transglutaminase-like putative cysteine protease